jgi:hypothetical protein
VRLAADIGLLIVLLAIALATRSAALYYLAAAQFLLGLFVSLPRHRRRNRRRAH